MGLLMKKACEKCSIALNGHAYICSHECTFCKECTNSMSRICPNCGGELVKRPEKGFVPVREKDSGAKALLVIDVQNAFNDKKWGERNNPNAEKNMNTILRVWREKNWKVFIVKHKSDHPSSLFFHGHKGYEVKEMIDQRNDDMIIEKKVNSSFIQTDLESLLVQHGITSVVTTGLTTPHCVSTTVRMSSNLGFKTYVVSDAVAAFGLKDQNNVYYDADTVHALSLATLNKEFAEIITTEQLVANIDLLR